MASAQEKAERNRHIVAASAAGETLKALASEFNLLERQTRAIIAAGNPVTSPPAEAMRLAHQRHAEYRAALAEVHDLTMRLPDGQASAKIGGFRVYLEGLDRLIQHERALGMLPTPLDNLAYQQQLADAVLDVLDRFEIPEAARRELAERLGVGG